jgi:hypothetical protein
MGTQANKQKAQLCLRLWRVTGRDLDRSPLTIVGPPAPQIVHGTAQRSPSLVRLYFQLPEYSGRG